MKVLILGGAGYVGSVLCEYLKQQGDDVTVFDNLLYEKGRRIDADFKFIHGDICNIDDLLPAIDTADAVVNLAAISNDPASDLSPSLTWQINYKANEIIAGLCKGSGKRVVYASSCSVYGFAQKGVFSEESELNPVSLYARTKMLSEDFYMSEGVDSVILRFATVYGDSGKPRFDLVVNTMIGTSFFDGKIIVNGGEQWRPVVHIKDVVRVIHLALHAKKLKNKVYNVGSNDQNYRISQLGEKIAKLLPEVDFVHNKNDLDKRSYLVDFSRLEKDFGFKTEFTIADAILEIYAKFKAGEIKSLEEDEYFRVKYLKKQLAKPAYRKRVFIERILA